jgi:ankyrin repeat protein
MYQSNFVPQKLPVQIIAFLLSIYPDGASQANNKGQLPLHLACIIGTTHVIDLLIGTYPAGLSHFDIYGYTPFHVACIEGNIPLIKHLASKLRHSSLPYTKDLVPPLFLACERNASLDVIFLLAQNSAELFSNSESSASPCTNGDNALVCHRKKRQRT